MEEGERVDARIRWPAGCFCCRTRNSVCFLSLREGTDRERVSERE